ncbi:MAG: NirD/YgiW/YdeI family stress tolerance protein [Treponema sp.]|nr:NirD/YgiW/YdeI family stress tolerance protein [Treponema sp.]MCL2237630.1 NirD/YgiW/YdeI family stress tolerance protein [Treponema sp.]
MRKYTVVYIGCFVMLISAGNIFAQTGHHGTIGQNGGGFVGPAGVSVMPGQAVMVNRAITVNEARNLPHDSWVVLAGNIINMLPGGRQYTFRDSTGEIAVDIGPKEWRGLSVDVTDRVEIYGEVKSHRGLFHIKVHAITGTGRVNRLPGQPVTVTAPITINEARNLPHDSWVVLSGNIVNAINTGRNHYTFRDNAGGEIIADIGRKEWRGLSVGVSDRIEILGEIKLNRGLIQIKVRAIRIMGA